MVNQADSPHYVIFGAYGGIGSALCRLLDAQGARVTAVGRDPERLDALVASLSNATAVQCDGTDFDAVEAVMKEASPVTGVANLIGSVILKPAHLTTAEEYQQTVRTNLDSAFAVTRAAGRTMRKGGSVVLTATAAAMTGMANHEAIAAAKGGIIGLTLSAAATYAPSHLRVNCVAPGLVETPMTEKITANEAARNLSLSMHALGRLGTPDDVARAIVFLLDPANDWITGQLLGVDGGLGRLMPKPRA